MRSINFVKLLASAALPIALAIALPNHAVAQSSCCSGDIAPGNVVVVGAGGYAQNGYGGGGPNSQGGAYSAGVALPIQFNVYGVSGAGDYVLASCRGANYNTGQGSAIYSSKSYSNIDVQFSWTPPGPGTYFIQCMAQYVPTSNPNQHGGEQGGTTETGEIIFTVN